MVRKVALITGGGRRLGRVIAIAIAEAGYDLAVGFNRSEAGARATADAARALGRRAHALQADLARAGEPEALVRAVEGLFGRLDLLVNSAALFPRERLEQVTDESAAATLRVNLIAPLLLSRAAWPLLRKHRGAIVNVGSLGGVLAYQEHLVYSLSKAALAHLTRALATRFAPEVRVNSIAPGSVRLGDEEPGAPLPPLDRIPLGRHAAPAEVAALVLFLAGEGDYVTGQTILLDGGRSLVS